MYALILGWWLLLSTALAAAAPPSPPPPPPSSHPPQKWIPGPTSGSDALARKGWQNLNEYVRRFPTNRTCRLEKAYRRKEWDSLRPQEKREYIQAVKCLQRKPALSGGIAPGAKSRFDDFVATHVNQTMSIHNTGNFLTWHRYFTWTYEKALREECGYRGYQPYINWPRLSNSVINAPIFDGSDTSLGGNGGPDPSRVPIVFSNVTIPMTVLHPAGGGGCVTSGPFKDTTVNLGPAQLDGYDPKSVHRNPRADGLGYNPRCFRRDLSVEAASGASDYNVTNLLANSPNISTFQGVLQGAFAFSPPQPFYGPHTSGHYIIGGDPGGDFFTSPGDPWFYLHHAQVDRVYWIWQNLHLFDEGEKWKQIAGTVTFFNIPPSRNARLDDRFDLGVNDGFRGMTIGEGMFTLEGERYCYVYE
ncbi:hypothetical protein CERZMDRAFT_66346 [Cercospora zeae-maydis SCOH1-5]|uniref:Tyrosinase copper-binding domain-containing protein n=1 Tax=Cercospora zeae-maydis SCOH1-5 TaxID=717836 RepID=A0A6A6FLC5_9PEZI|nr:hypothetical protein CERZMDRAFT_66346 [Cercospora zeae-maydis SCOH1-5]